jgi:predicted AAA+ superfamily ATPase
MDRSKLADLIAWKNSPDRKPLIIRGARQTGKTWLMKEFGEKHYAKTVYINFEKSKRLAGLFADDFDVARIIVALQAESGLTITPDDTLLVFDEIQAVPEAITALKYFLEDGPGYHVIAAGSLLGLAIHEGVSFPVGKVALMDLSPMTFTEFLEAAGESALVEMLHSGDWKLITVFKTKYIERLRQYYFVGGMPEAVAQFARDQDFKKVREIQNQILDTYELDFSKHAPEDIIPRIRMLWNSVPSQLARENRKFIYGAVREGSRARDYEMALSWLIDCRQVHKVCRVSKPAMPLKAYEESNAFKLFLVDTGLLAAMGDLDARTLLEGHAVFSEFKGALTEQYVHQQLAGNEALSVYYWSAERSSAEVGFLLQHKNVIVPVEVKAEENLHSKSLRAFRDRFSPFVSVRTSMSDYRREEWLINLPLYALSEIGNVLDRQGSQ